MIDARQKRRKHEELLAKGIWLAVCRPKVLESRQGLRFAVDAAQLMGTRLARPSEHKRQGQARTDRGRARRQRGALADLLRAVTALRAATRSGALLTYLASVQDLSSGHM